MVFCPRSADLRDVLADLRERLAPQGINIRVFTCDPDGGFRGTAKIYRDMRRLACLDGRECLFETIIAAVMIEGRGTCPFVAQDVEIFVGALVALILADETAVLPQFRIIAA